MPKKKAEISPYFASNARLMMEILKMKPIDVQKRSGISGRMVSFVINGERVPTLDVASAIASAFDLELWQMLAPNFAASQKPRRKAA